MEKLKCIHGWTETTCPECYKKCAHGNEKDYCAFCVPSEHRIIPRWNEAVNSGVPIIKGV